MALSKAVLDDLRASYAMKDLIIFAGAGISTAAGLPTWKGLAEKLRDRMISEGRPASEIDEVNDLLSQRRLIDALSVAERALGAHEFGIEVDKAVNDDPLLEPDIALAIAELAPALRGVITTNLDRFLERAFHGRWQDFSSPPADLPRRRNYIFKPHGTKNDRSTWVFTRGQYDQATFGQPTHRKVIETLFSAFPILFVGAGMADDDLDQILGTTRALAGSNPPMHFALLKTPIPSYRRDLLAKSGIRILEYDNHDDVPKILRSIP